MQQEESQSEQEEQPLSENGRTASQPEPEQQSTSKQADDSKSEPEEQPLPGKERDESQPEPEQQPTTEVAADQGQPRLQARPAASIPLPPTQQQKQRQYFLGLGLGFIPLIIFFIAFAPNAFGLLGWFSSALYLSLFLYIVELIVTIFCLNTREVRPVGYGLLTAFLVSPVVAFIGCTVIIYHQV